jgi:hypothetical protein
VNLCLTWRLALGNGVEVETRGASLCRSGSQSGIRSGEDDLIRLLKPLPQRLCTCATSANAARRWVGGGAAAGTEP